MGILERGMVQSRPLRLPFSMRRVASVQRLADAEILLSDTETRCSVSVSYTHLTLPTNREV